MQTEALEALQRMDYRMESKRLLVHAIHESRRYLWRRGPGVAPLSGGREALLARGASPADIVQQAMLLTMNGSRPWNQEKYPDIVNHLRWVIRSLISNLATSADNRQVQELPADPEENQRQELPETSILRGSVGPEAADLSSRIQEAINDDPQLVEVLDRLQQGGKPRDVAAIMGLAEKDVYRLTQKLRRRLAPVLGASA
jgi:hypothetical protein